MTIDDDSSIYVGGLPYDVSEESLRKAFYTYGAVIAVKIINDQAVSGKCYGFVTFANPRSATQAIKEMDGKTIDGRIVKVNDVRSRGGKPNFNRESFRRGMDRGIAGHRGRDHGGNDSQSRRRHRDGHRESSLDYDQDRERGHSRVHGNDRGKDRHLDEERFRDYDRHVDGVEKEQERKRDRDWERDSDQNVEERRKNGHHNAGVRDKHQEHHFVNRSSFDDHENREPSLESFNDQNQVESKLASSNQNLEELRMEVSQITEVAADQEIVVSELWGQCQKLEDSLNTAKKLTSHRHQQLAKLHRCYLQVRDYNDRLKTSELELQFLVESISMELGKDIGLVDTMVVNGKPSK